MHLESSKYQNTMAPIAQHKKSSLVTEFGAMLLVGASFFPNSATAAEFQSPNDQLANNTPRTPLVAEHRAMPGISSPTAPAVLHHFRSEHKEKSFPLDGVGFLSPIVNVAKGLDETWSDLKAGSDFRLPALNDGYFGHVAFSSHAGIKFSIESRDPDRTPGLTVTGEPFKEGGKLELRISLF